MTYTSAPWTGRPPQAETWKRTVSDCVEGSTLETSIAELKAEVPLEGGLAGPYRVTLRAAGPYRYYLATSIGAGAPPRLLADAELLSASFRPNVEVDQKPK